MNYREADKEYFEIAEEVLTKWKGGILSKTKYPHTYRALIGFCAKTNALKTAIFEMHDSNNPYALYALERCFDEHYLKFTYIFTRLITEKTDTVGEEYFRFCGALEAVEYIDAIQMANNLLDKDVALKFGPILEGIYQIALKTPRKELKAKSDQFKYRSIIRYLNKALPGAINKERPFFANLIPGYALLSSFVHGGPYSDIAMAEFSKPSTLENCNTRTEVIFMMTASVMMFTTMIMGQEFNEYLPYSIKINDLITHFGKS